MTDSTGAAERKCPRCASPINVQNFDDDDCVQLTCSSATCNWNAAALNVSRWIPKPAEAGAQWLRRLVNRLDAENAAHEHVEHGRPDYYAVPVRIQAGKTGLFSDPELRDAVHVDQLRALLDERERLLKRAERAEAECKEWRKENRLLRYRAEEAEAIAERVRQAAAHPSSTQGYVRNYVAAADILAALEQPEET